MNFIAWGHHWQEQSYLSVICLPRETLSLQTVYAPDMSALRSSANKIAALSCGLQDGGVSVPAGCQVFHSYNIIEVFHRYCR